MALEVMLLEAMLYALYLDEFPSKCATANIVTVSTGTISVSV